MLPKVYIDGKEGTTGLQIYERLGTREDLSLLLIDEEKRKDPDERKKFLNEADVVFLCLPDAAAVEAVRLIENPNTRVIDASTAHRTAPGWEYGFAELSRLHRACIQNSKRVSNPGCHASGFIAMVYPLVAMGVLPLDYPLSCFSLTGYSGGGKKMIADYEAENRPGALSAPRIYGLNLQHKHLPEMQRRCGLTRAPAFSPIVDPYYNGMATSIHLHTDLLLSQKSAKEIWTTLSDYYQGQRLLTVAPFGHSDAMIAANTKAGTDGMELVVCGHEDQVLITALFDNLGKGASGAAVQNMNLMLGLDETTGLILP